MWILIGGSINSNNKSYGCGYFWYEEGVGVSKQEIKFRNN